MNNFYNDTSELRRADAFSEAQCLRYSFGHIVTQEARSAGLDFTFKVISTDFRTNLVASPDQAGLYLMILLAGSVTFTNQPAVPPLQEKEIALLSWPRDAVEFVLPEGITSYLLINIDSVLAKFPKDPTISALLHLESKNKGIIIGALNKGDYRLLALVHLLLNSSLTTTPKISLYQTTITILQLFLEQANQEKTAIGRQYEAEQEVARILCKPFRTADLHKWEILKDIIYSVPTDTLVDKFGYKDEKELATDFRRTFSFAPGIFRWPHVE